MIWLVRHGESEANAGGVTSDFAAINLTARGQRQAISVADACAARPDWIGVSEYLRARQTAEPLIRRNLETPVCTLAVHEFTYLAPSRCVGTDSKARQPLVDAYWARLLPEFSDGDGAESFATFWKRVQSFLDRVELRTGFGVVFTHEQFIRGLMLRVMYPFEDDLQLTMRRFCAMRSGFAIPNGAIVRIHWNDDRWWTAGIDDCHLA